MLETPLMIFVERSFIKKSSDIMDAYYPGRVCRLIICNAPFWFYSVWSVVANVLSDSVKKKISIINGCKGLAEFIEPDQRPLEYEGTGRPLGQSEEHLKFVELSRNWGPLKAGNTASTADLAVTTGDKSHETAQTVEIGNSSGIMGWMRNRMTASGGSSSPGSSSSAQATSAYLGEKNM
jgi:hypothetical protein